MFQPRVRICFSPVCVSVSALCVCLFQPCVCLFQPCMCVYFSPVCVSVSALCVCLFQPCVRVCFSSCPLQARSLLRAVLAEFQRTGLEEARLGRVYEQMAAFCRFEGK